jgi:HEAT repeat protein
MNEQVTRTLEAFSERWPEDRQDFRRQGDDSWKSYATALRDLVAAGPGAGVEEALGHTNRQVRAMAARAVGFINSPESVPLLSAALLGDEWATVRLLAADSLGMLHTAAAAASLERAGEDENKDVRLHVEIALSRRSGLEADAVADLLAIDERCLGSATIGREAPAFALPTTSSRVALGDHREQRAVALYFLYGDG